MRAVSLVGSTGSIGTQALEVIARAPDEFRVVALAASSSVTALAEQANLFRPDVVGIVDSSLAETLASLVPKGTEVISGQGVLAALAGVGDIVLNAVVGFAGLSVTVEALSSGRRLALANKESLIAGAPVVQRARAMAGAEIVPVDSEHCAIHQCLAERARSYSPAPDVDTFSCLALAFAAGREGGDSPAWLNAANEVAVDAFFAGRIGWLDIAMVVEGTLERHDRGELTSVEDVLE